MTSLTTTTSAPGGPWHAGELTVQQRAGVRHEAEHLTGMLQPRLFPAAAALLARTPVLVVAGVHHHDAYGTDGRLWACGLVGTPPAVPLDDRHLVLRFTASTSASTSASTGSPGVAVVEPPTDLLTGVLRGDALVGMIAIDFPARRRLRVNGRVVAVTGQGALVRTEQVYGNCPKYIQPRTWQHRTSSDAIGGPSAATPSPPPALIADTAPHLTDLTDLQAGRLRAADTFVLATVHPDAGVDVSHRGGPPGSLHVERPRQDAGHRGWRISWIDLPGNNMFNSAGNIVVDPRAALWLPPIDNHDTALMVSGTARLLWPDTGPGTHDPATAATAHGQRRFVLDVEAVTEAHMKVHLTSPVPPGTR